MRKLLFTLSFLVVLIVIFADWPASKVGATHSWNGYHWARTANPFTLKLGSNVSAAWSPYLSTTSSDWSKSSFLHTTVALGGSSAKRCGPSAGKVEVCDYSYGNNGWLGLAQIWVSSDHITQATTKLNDTYFNKAAYNKTGWKNLVMCQEVGHTFGLAHQDEIFDNPNLGTCMDYTNDPDGTIKNQLSNEHPNGHDLEELGIIYAHLDPFTTVSGNQKQTLGSTLSQSNKNEIFENQSDWGKEIKNNRKVALYERDLGMKIKLVTFVIWAQ